MTHTALDRINLEADGRQAFKKGWPATECPYAFKNTPCWQDKDYERFDREFRWKMDAWMDGWIGAQKAAK